ncbi:MAG: glycosyltransferase family 39 protein [candidate division WOR-3 bacterium]|nr:MAG: glycosyltransferase family 39 protein [candidate division WOR-3 bacterium]
MAALLLATAWSYGPFGDEFYYIDCSKNLDFGYVDHPPLVALIVLIVRNLFGDSYIWLRAVSALAGALSILLASRITKKLGGGRFAQTITALAMVAAPGFWAIFSFYSMNALDIVIIALATIVLIEIMMGGPAQLWLVFGVIAGLGLQNKLTMLVFAFALLVGLVVTRRRFIMTSIWPFAGGVIAGLIFLPNIIWQVVHGWPTLEFIRLTQQYSIYPQSAFGFLWQIILALNPVVFPLWMGGVLYLLFGKEGKKFRALGILSLVFLLTYILQRSKVYYVFPVIPLLLAGGAIVFERYCERIKRTWVKAAAIATIVFTGLILLPFGLPVVPIEYFIPYSKAIGLVRHVQIHRGDRIDLPVHFALKFGWREMVENVARAFETLSPEERLECIIITNNFSKAGAINYYRGDYGLPEAISGHNNYRFWVPGNQQLKAAVAIGIDKNFLLQYFHDVKLFDTHIHPYAATWEVNQEIFVCRNPTVTWSELRQRLKWY